MVPGWFLIGESVVLGLVIALAIPVWGLLPQLFGVAHDTPRGRAWSVQLLLLFFPAVTILSMVTAFLLPPDQPLRWLCVVAPLLHLVILYRVRVRQ